MREPENTPFRISWRSGSAGPVRPPTRCGWHLVQRVCRAPIDSDGFSFLRSNMGVNRACPVIQGVRSTPHFLRTVGSVNAPDLLHPQDVFLGKEKPNLGRVLNVTKCSCRAWWPHTVLWCRVVVGFWLDACTQS